MIKSIKIVSIVLIIVSFLVLLFLGIRDKYDKIIQNKVIDNAFSVDVNTDYLGYIYIPRFDIKRLIKSGTDLDVLDSGYVGMYYKSGNLIDDNLIILAGHNIKTVFGSLHSISVGDYVYLCGFNFNRKFVVYDTKVVEEHDFNYFHDRRYELLLITCDKQGYRLLVFLKEEL